MKLGQDVSVLDEWYKRDDNAEPAVYYLLPITDILTNYDNQEEDQASLKDKVSIITVHDVLLEKQKLCRYLRPRG